MGIPKGITIGISMGIRMGIFMCISMGIPWKLCIVFCILLMIIEVRRWTPWTSNGGLVLKAVTLLAFAIAGVSSS
jgi:hypothetical protein